MINDIVCATILVRKHIEQKTLDKTKNITTKNNLKHSFIETELGKKYWILFKRQFFLSFGRIFPEQKGIGESINKSFIHTAIAEKVTQFVFVYEDGKIYTIKPEEFKKFAEDNRTIRITKMGEETYSIPVTLLQRWV